jgi:hypothetical protein
MMVVLDQHGSMLGAWAPPLWYMFELIPFKAKLAVSNGFGSRTTKVFFFLFLWKK